MKYVLCSVLCALVEVIARIACPETQNLLCECWLVRLSTEPTNEVLADLRNDGFHLWTRIN